MKQAVEKRKKRKVSALAKMSMALGSCLVVLLVWEGIDLVWLWLVKSRATQVYSAELRRQDGLLARYAEPGLIGQFEVVRERLGPVARFEVMDCSVDRTFIPSQCEISTVRGNKTRLEWIIFDAWKGKFTYGDFPVK